MDAIRRQVRRACWRLNIAKFFDVVPWTLTAALAVAAAAIAIPKIWSVDVDQLSWLVGWTCAAIAIGLLCGGAVAWFTRRNSLDAAIEMDRRCSLKERVSSVIAIDPSEAASPAGEALVADAQRRVERVEIHTAFPLRMRWPAFLPLFPAVLGALIALKMPDATRAAASVSTEDIAARRRIQRSAQELSRKLAERTKRVENTQLKDAESLLKQLKGMTDEMARRDDVNRKEALVKMNELAKEIERRRELLGGAEELQRQLERLKDFERGPADRAADALRQGDPQKAIQELKRLQNELTSGKLTKQEQQNLARQLRDLQRKMQEFAERHRKAKEDLQRQMQQKLSEDDREAAAEIQRKLDELKQQDSAMQRLDEMGSRMKKASESLEQGDAEMASSELREMSEDLQEMQAELDQIKELDELMNEVGGAKNAMKCEQCDGEGCTECQSGFAEEAVPVEGKKSGEGTGAGDRPENATATGTYDARERAKSRAGESVRVGDAQGPNRAGLSQQQIRDEITNALREDADPISEQRLPRSQQDHVRQYYERRRKGQ